MWFSNICTGLGRRGKANTYGVKSWFGGRQWQHSHRLCYGQNFTTRGLGDPNTFTASSKCLPRCWTRSPQKHLAAAASLLFYHERDYLGTGDCPCPGPGAAQPSPQLQGRANTHGLTSHTHAPCLAGPLCGPTCKITFSCSRHFGFSGHLKLTSELSI